jgi:hypothetical protein
MLAEVIEPRVEELFDAWCRRSCDRAGYSSEPAASGIVLTGGSAAMHGMVGTRRGGVPHAGARGRAGRTRRRRPRWWRRPRASPPVIGPAGRSPSGAPARPGGGPEGRLHEGRAEQPRDGPPGSSECPPRPEHRAATARPPTPGHLP